PEDIHKQRDAMNKMRQAVAGLIAMLAVAGICGAQGAMPATSTASVSLNAGWQIQSSCEAKATGEQISTAGFAATGWHKTTVPNTVVGALVDDKTYPDPTYGTNLKNLPGMNYSSATFFALQDMPEGSPFKCSWWWRKEFSVPSSGAGKHMALHFPGINYRANVWLNGKKIADTKDVVGTYRIFEFDVTSALKAGSPNTVALEIFAPGKDDLGITWVDWNPTPADKDMGIWKEVSLTMSGPVAIRHPFVSSKLDSEYKSAELTLSAELRNDSGAPASGTLSAEVDGKQLKQAVELAAGETKVVRFDSATYPQLKLAAPKLWWPYTVGTPNLYTAKFSFVADGKTSDSASIKFGIREVTSELTDKGHRLFKINGHKILIRGAAWAPDMFLRPMSKKMDADLRYVKHMGLNTIRLEGRIDRDEFFDKTDEMGILVMPGWTCCDAWERWEVWTDETRAVAAGSMKDQAVRLRTHPSVYVWLYGSDNPPPAAVERMYLDILKAADWPNPSVSSASEQPTPVTGSSGVKMTGPYEYVPPIYWYADKEAGGAHGYNTETSPGPAIPTLESVKKFIPKEHLWPMDDVWNYHAGGERFTNVNVFTDALTQRYGAPKSLEDYERKAQAMTYDGERAMFESYGRNKYVSTGVIQWMLNNAWPSLIWHLYDYYLVPGGGYFGTKKAMEPLHVQFDYADHAVAVVNDTYNAHNGMKVVAKVFNLNGKEIASHDEKVDVPGDASVKAFDLPRCEGLTVTFFAKLQMFDPAGKLVSDNFYWLSAKEDTLDWKHRRDTVYTPQAEFGDLSGLESLPEVTVAAATTFAVAGGGATTTIANTGKGVAFMVHLRLVDAKGEDVVPVFWSDNYVTLLPGEKRALTAKFTASTAQGLKVVCDGWNVKAGPAAKPASKVTEKK
ncbi:MAG TPA: glycoside hydrolase family 2 protein, partial [Candidatus Dormibacteraeota bacterium]|nr:glycoside hydrolase family 2 protein [Candidatus Dormibacteraeota bacterium]